MVEQYSVSFSNEHSALVWPTFGTQDPEEESKRTNASMTPSLRDPVCSQLRHRGAGQGDLGDTQMDEKAMQGLFHPTRVCSRSPYPTNV